MAFGIDDIIGAGMQIINKVMPDPAAKAAAELELYRMKQAGEFKEIEARMQEMQMQADTNKVEAASANIFVAGWRPFIGWVCGVALAYQYIGRPLILAALTSAGYPPPVLLPLDDTLWQLLLGMLGLGGLRTFEKSKGVA